MLVSLWNDPSIASKAGRPSSDHRHRRGVAKLTAALADQPQAMFGIINEPQNNYDGAQDAQVWTPDEPGGEGDPRHEDAAAAPNHIVTVQGTGGWARRLNYYATHPITERSGANIAYEVHVYNPASDFSRCSRPTSATLPLIIGEFGPMSGAMTQADCTTLMDRAQALEIPHMAWTFHMRCDPNLLVDNSGGGCGIGMTLAPTRLGHAAEDSARDAVVT